MWVGARAWVRGGSEGAHHAVLDAAKDRDEELSHAVLEIVRRSLHFQMVIVGV